MALNVLFLPGDGIGPEVTSVAFDVLNSFAETFGMSVSTEHAAFGGAAIDQTGSPYPDDTRQRVALADAVFLGAVGGPKWDGGVVRPEQGLLDLRRDLKVFANLRPTRVEPGLVERSPLKAETIKGTDFVIVRELNGGIYYGQRVEGMDKASDQCAYSKEEVRQVARVAFIAARERSGKLTSVDKANVLATSRLWRSAVTELQQQEFSDVALEHVLVDAMAMHLITRPTAFDVILTENMFGDILSDEASVLSGSIGLAPSASLGNGPGLYEPIHGSAPDIAGQGLANPAGAIMSIAMLVRYTAKNENAASTIEAAVRRTLEGGTATRDLGGDASTQSFAAAVLSNLRH
ncbi:MAG: 3-isopropylmalate dehydrogenase [Pseudomonadota bacterium]